jgi:hypothetical protein
MRRVQEATRGVIELKFPASAIDVNMELRDFPVGTYRVEPMGVREERVVLRPVNAPGADEEYELSIETFMQRINSAGEFTPLSEEKEKTMKRVKEQYEQSMSSKGAVNQAHNVANFLKGAAQFIEMLTVEGYVNKNTTVITNINRLQGDPPFMQVHIDNPVEFSLGFDNLLRLFYRSEFGPFVEIEWNQDDFEDYVELYAA